MGTTRRTPLALGLWLAAFAPGHTADLEPIGAEFQVNSYGTGLQTLPGLAVGPAGELFVVWQDGILGVPGQDGDDGGIRGRRFDSNGLPIGAEFPVNVQTTRSQEAPEAVWTASDEVLVVWSGWDQLGGSPETTSSGIRARRFPASAVPTGAEFTVNAYTEGDQQDAAVAAGPAGETVVAWWERSGLDGDGDGIRARRFDSGGGARGSEFTVNAFTTGNQFGPEVAIGPDGAFVVVWSGSGTNAEPGVHSRRFLADGTAYGGQRRVSEAAGMQRDATVAVDGGGRFLVAWFDLAAVRIRGRLLAPTGVPVGAAFAIDQDDDAGRRLPQVAASVDDDFLVTWEGRPSRSPPDTYYQVRARRLSSSGLFLGAERTLSSVTTRDQWRSAPAALPDGDFLVTWEDRSGNDGSAPGIRARRFGPPTPVFADDFESGDGCAWADDVPGGLC